MGTNKKKPRDIKTNRNCRKKQKGRAGDDSNRLKEIEWIRRDRKDGSRNKGIKIV